MAKETYSYGKRDLDEISITVFTTVFTTVFATVFTKRDLDEIFSGNIVHVQCGVGEGVGERVLR